MPDYADCLPFREPGRANLGQTGREFGRWTGQATGGSPSGGALPVKMPTRNLVDACFFKGKKKVRHPCDVWSESVLGICLNFCYCPPCN
jgi:hypothetical protein